MDTVTQPETLEEKLARLHNLRKQASTMQAHYGKLAQQAIPPEVHKVIEDIGAELETSLRPLMDTLEKLDAEILAGTIKAAASVYTDSLICVYNSGGESIKVSDARLCAARWQIAYPDVAADILACIKAKKASANIQERKGNGHA